MSWVVELPNNQYKPITNTAWVRARLCKLQKRCTRLAAASDKVYQLLAHGRLFSPASSTTKTGRHDIAEILLKVALSTINQIKSNQIIASKVRTARRYQKGTFIRSRTYKKDRQYNCQKKKYKRTNNDLHKIATTTKKTNNLKIEQQGVKLGAREGFAVRIT